MKNELGYFVHDWESFKRKRFWSAAKSKEIFYLVGFDKDLNFHYPEPTSQKVAIKDILDDEIKVKGNISFRQNCGKVIKKEKKKLT